MSGKERGPTKWTEGGGKGSGGANKEMFGNLYVGKSHNEVHFFAHKNKKYN